MNCKLFCYLSGWLQFKCSAILPWPLTILWRSKNGEDDVDGMFRHLFVRTRLGTSLIRLATWLSFNEHRITALLLALIGVLFSVLAIFSCNFSTVEVDTDHFSAFLADWYEASPSYHINLGLFRYVVTENSIDFTDSAECRIYDQAFSLVVNGEFVESGLNMAQLCSFLAPIIAILGVFGTLYDTFCKLSPKVMFGASLSWCLAGLSQIVGYFMFPNEDFW